MHFRIKRFKTPEPFDIGLAAYGDQEGQTIDFGYIVATPAYYLHTLKVSPLAPNPRHVVEALTQFAHGFALHARDHALPGSFAPSEILFHVSPDNAKMAAWVESKGATSEDARLYRLPL